MGVVEHGMLELSQPVNLRRPVWAWLLGVHGLAALSLVSALPSMYFLVTIGDPLLVAPVAASVFCFVILIATRVVLYPDRVESGFRLFPKSIERSNIVEVREGKVLWGRGYLTGIVVILDDNSSAPIAGSAPLSKKVRQSWIADIRVWIEADDGQ